MKQVGVQDENISAPPIVKQEERKMKMSLENLIDGFPTATKARELMKIPREEMNIGDLLREAKGQIKIACELKCEKVRYKSTYYPIEEEIEGFEKILTRLGYEFITFVMEGEYDSTRWFTIKWGKILDSDKELAIG